jgi:hypothetical protein
MGFGRTWKSENYGSEKSRLSGTTCSTVNHAPVCSFKPPTILADSGVSYREIADAMKLRRFESLGEGNQ